jgi:hypothetical protein
MLKGIMPKILTISQSYKMEYFIDLDQTIGFMCLATKTNANYIVGVA